MRAVQRITVSELRSNEQTRLTALARPPNINRENEHRVIASRHSYARIGITRCLLKQMTRSAKPHARCVIQLPSPIHLSS